MAYKVTSKDEIFTYCKKIYKDGYKKGLPTGIESLNNHYTFRKCELDIFTGFANIGKTTAQLFFMILSSIKYDWKWLLYCPENEPVGDLMIDIAEMICGKTADKDFNNRMTSDEFMRALQWSYDHFHILSFDETPTITDVLKSFEDYMEVVEIDGCSIDPLNDLKAPSNINKYDYYYDSLSDIRRFIKKHNVKFNLIVHPSTQATRKRNEDGTRPAPTMSDVEYGAMFGNRADNFIVFHRNPHSDNWNVTEIHIQKIKFQKLVGVPTPEHKPICLYYSYKKRRFEFMNSKGQLQDPLKIKKQ